MADVTIEPGQVWCAPRRESPMGYVVVETTSLATAGPAAAVWVSDVVRTSIDQYRRVGERRVVLRDGFLQCYQLSPHRMPTDPPAHPRLKLVNVAIVRQLAEAHGDVVADIAIFEDPTSKVDVRGQPGGVRLCRQVQPEAIARQLLTALEERRMEIEAELVRLGVDIE